MRIHDVSLPIGVGTAIYPGDPPYRVGWPLCMEKGDPTNVAQVSFGVHIGTHVDGPRHIGAEGPSIGGVGLEAFVGRAVVVDASGRGELGPELVEALDLARAERVLFRSRARVNPGEFPHGFSGIAPALARRLVEAGVRLVGVDTPSVDPEGSESLEAHHILIEGGVAILENLVLSEVAAGEYTLVALPLKLVEADSSPVRAVLIEEAGES